MKGEEENYTQPLVPYQGKDFPASAGDAGDWDEQLGQIPRT